ncbi:MULTISPECIES: amino acid permease [Enterococcus]|uniref:amino acid permease n=1 Tax=Enterococcus TaxID=1350 RepID=UPI00065E6D55|nr:MULTISPECIES: amino acid permease [Enterococcus]KAF1301429.1 amino acid permease [Enterococcus sp. JM9B]
MENKLQKKLHSRHVTMLALGGAIGAGLFKGSGEAIGLAGPSVLLAFLLGGCLLYSIMSSAGALAMKNTHARSLSEIVEPYIGKFSAYFTDWLYWTLWMINVIAEAVAAASFMQLWFPNTPAWIFILGISLITTLINFLSVRIFAETEFWLTVGKISVVLLLIAFAGFLVVQQIFGEGFFPTMQSMTTHGGFFPHKLQGLFNSLLLVIYSYGGTELIIIAMGETEDPERSIPKAIHSVIFRIIAFYIVPMFLLLIIYPWQELAQSNVSPFVMVFEKMNIPFAADLVNLVIVLALFSSINSGIYASSRILHLQLSKSKRFSKHMKLNKHGVPNRAVMVSTATLYAGVLLSYIFGEELFTYLVGSLSYTVLMIWLILCIAYFNYLRKFSTSKIKRGINLLTLVSLGGIFLAIFSSNNPAVTLVTAGIYGLIVGSYFISRKHSLLTANSQELP